MNQQPFYLIAASLLNANFACIGKEASAVLAKGADRLHLDIMDNHYVPQLTVGPLLCKALRDFGIEAPIDVHIMANPVDALIDASAAAGATTIIIHPEACQHLDASLERIIQHGCQAGVALNPATTLHHLEYIIEKLSIILIMSVNPGKGGQAFIPKTIEKIKTLTTWCKTQIHQPSIAVDGGINTTNITAIRATGATHFVVGSAIFSNALPKDYALRLQTLRKALL